jgi:hypothetical protein
MWESAYATMVLPSAQPKPMTLLYSRQLTWDAVSQMGQQRNYVDGFSTPTALPSAYLDIRMPFLC